MCFEFMYAGTNFKYENGWIYQKDKFGVYVNFCPVHHALNCHAEMFNLEQLSLIMGSVVHGYFYGASTGKAELQREVKRIFNID